MTSQTSSGFTHVDVFILQSGASLQSQEVILNNSCQTQGTMTGSVNGNNIIMTISLDTIPDTITVSGTLSGNSITGSYTSSGPCVGSDKGTLSAQLVPSISSSQWSGSIDSGSGQSTMSGSITEDSSTGNLTANFTFAAGFCLSQVSMTGNLIGNYVGLGNSSGTLSLTGNADPLSKNLSGNYVDSCQFGFFNLWRP